ncbi:hypothetical protein [Sphingomonas carotinifaciens]|uniref:L,D-transpeptidase n=1 Tax=Sphingomonas carotinifaciens TaxID=1166323 RepID=A0A1G7P490_9SPHN|nr:hypothetical protein [Sphingomonas carotinifaciens]MBB4087302.1 hypothetical protein [Sphingomonas carotinifaciens]MWC44673.1 hypothetical protein [Sphingomonas carotinifaciens]SDF81126.1 hypothetical protein SAMN05216557_10657 [Sphingomonas carotinifaciens]
MIHVLRALTGLALILPVVAEARTTRVKAPQPVSAVSGDAETPITPSPAADRVAQWVATTKDNRALPWAVVDKENAALFLFDGKGKPLGAVPVLIGIATGDTASPGVGNKKLADLGPAEKTTPAGRFLAKFGMAVAGERVLWVDYATSVAIHPIPKDAAAREKRRERMLSPTPEDNRITFGCINVPKAFYGRVLRPLFRGKGGYVYVLPDSTPIEAVFPRLRVQAVMNGG